MDKREHYVDKRFSIWPGLKRFRRQRKFQSVEFTPTQNAMHRFARDPTRNRAFDHCHRRRSNFSQRPADNILGLCAGKLIHEEARIECGGLNLRFGEPGAYATIEARKACHNPLSDQKDRSTTWACSSPEAQLLDDHLCPISAKSFD